MTISKSSLDKIRNRYDPENDVRRDGPPVTWAEYELMEVVRELVKAVEKLQTRVDELEAIQ